MGILGELFAAVSNKAVTHRGIKQVISPFGEETNLDVFKEVLGSKGKLSRQCSDLFKRLCLIHFSRLQV